MTKKELISLVAKEANIAVAEATRILDAFFDVFMKNVSNEEICLPIGKFKSSMRAARSGRNPQNGQPIEIPASSTVKFKISKPFKDELNKLD